MPLDHLVIGSLDYPQIEDEDQGLRRHGSVQVTQAGGAGPATRPQSLNLTAIAVSPSYCSLCIDPPVSPDSW